MGINTNINKTIKQKLTNILLSHSGGQSDLKLHSNGHGEYSDAYKLINQLKGRVDSEFVTRRSFYISVRPDQINTLMVQDQVQYISFYPPPPITNNDSTSEQCYQTRHERLVYNGDNPDKNH